jgi:hypothetical protein
MVSEARSCRPRRSRSVSSGGIAVSRIAVRTSAQRNPTRPPPVRIVLMPASRFPTVNPVVAVRMYTSTAKTAMVQNCEPVSQYATSMQSSQSMNSASTRRGMLATLPGPRSGRPNR